MTSLVKIRLFWQKSHNTTQMATVGCELTSGGYVGANVCWGYVGVNVGWP